MQRKNSRRYFIFCLLTVLLLVGCKGEPNGYEHTEFALDTVIRFKVYGENAQTATEQAIVELKRLDKMLSSYSGDSEINQINANAGQPVQVSPETLAVVERALNYARITDGVFDPTIGAVSKLWLVGKQGNFVPEQGQIEQALSLVDYTLVETDMEESTVKLGQEGMQLDLGGVAKGYILERLRDILLQNGIKSALINGGGDVLTIGKRPDGKLWRVGVQDPRKTDGMAAVVDMKVNSLISTSGDYQRYFIKDGVRYHHIFDTQTGYPADSGLASATVLTNKGDKELPSNIFMILGRERSLQFVKVKYPHLQLILVGENGTVTATEGIRPYMVRN